MVQKKLYPYFIAQDEPEIPEEEPLEEALGEEEEEIERTPGEKAPGEETWNPEEQN